MVARESKNVSIVEKFGCHKRAERLLLRRTVQRAAAVHESVPGTDCVAEVCGYRSEAAASISRDGSHHPLFAER